MLVKVERAAINSDYPAVMNRKTKSEALLPLIVPSKCSNIQSADKMQNPLNIIILSYFRVVRYVKTKLDNAANTDEIIGTLQIMVTKIIKII